jgi:putative nucleotidyltransferase with HDIG domain
MKLEFTYLHSRLGRRIFWLFVLCALLPISVLALVSLLSVSYELKSQSRRRLSQVARDEGMMLLGRLTLLDEKLRTIGAAYEDDPRQMEREHLPFNVDSQFAAVARILPNDIRQMLAGDRMGFLSLSEKEQEFVDSGKTVLKIEPCGGTERCIYLILRPQTQRGQRVLLAGEVRQDFLWSSDEIPAAMNLCVRDQHEEVLFCSTNEQQLVVNHVSKDQEWKQGGKEYITQTWRIPLKAKFLEDSWTIIVSQTSEAALSSLGSFRFTFPLVISLALWIVLLLSIIEIRRTLIPLERLREGTKKVAAGEFGARVDVRSNDEFKELAASFNHMAGRIETQVHSLKALNEIDRAILSSWDLGDVVQSLLSRLPGLVTYHIAGVAVIGQDPVNQSISHIARPHGGVHAISVEISAQDLRMLSEQEESFVITGRETLPRYLEPMAAREIKQFQVLPVLVESKPAAVLAFGCTVEQAWTKEDRQQARRVADQVAVAISNAKLVNQLKELRWGTLLALARAIDAKSPWTAGHSERVTDMAMKIGRELGLSEEDLDTLHAGGLLHDVGKIGTPLHLLDKPGPLTPEERFEIQDHVTIGVRILGPIPGFEEYLPIVREHHEWFNGKGYPHGIAGENISLLARVLAVADVYDALISDRPYRKGMPISQVEAIIRRGSSAQFDPRIVDAFLRLLEKEGLSAVQDSEEPVTLGRD